MAVNIMLENHVFIAFDTETTGLSAIACRLVELSAVKFKLERDNDGRLVIVDLGTFSTLIDPEQPIPIEVSRIHGITDSMIAGAPTCGQALDDFLTFIDEPDAVLMAHNAGFDIEFIRVNCLRLNKPLPAFPVVDTVPLAHKHVNDAANYKLKTLSEHFGFAGSTYHRALDDSFYVQKLFHRLCIIGDCKSLEDIRQARVIMSFVAPPAEICRDGLSQDLQRFVDTLEIAIASGESLKLKYDGPYVSTRVIDPSALIDSRGSLYLSAFCRKVQAERTFRLDRILDLQPNVSHAKTKKR